MTKAPRHHIRYCGAKYRDHRNQGISHGMLQNDALVSEALLPWLSLCNPGHDLQKQACISLAIAQGISPKAITITGRIGPSSCEAEVEANSVIGEK